LELSFRTFTTTNVVEDRHRRQAAPSCFLPSEIPFPTLIAHNTHRSRKTARVTHHNLFQVHGSVSNSFQDEIGVWDRAYGASGIEVVERRRYSEYLTREVVYTVDTVEGMSRVRFETKPVSSEEMSIESKTSSSILNELPSGRKTPYLTIPTISRTNSSRLLYNTYLMKVDAK
jgi:hypothetical protein